jgi:serine protease AprX
MKTAQKGLPTYMTSIDAITQMTFSGQADIFTVGAGYLDIQAALANTDLVKHAALSPTAVFVTHHTITLANTLSTLWGADDSVVWGDTVVFGNFAFKGILNGNSVVWGADDSVVWGDDTMDGWSVVWGDSALTGASIMGLASDDDDQ